MAHGASFPALPLLPSRPRTSYELGDLLTDLGPRAGCGAAVPAQRLAVRERQVRHPAVHDRPVPEGVSAFALDVCTSVPVLICGLWVCLLFHCIVCARVTGEVRSYPIQRFEELFQS